MKGHSPSKQRMLAPPLDPRDITVDNIRDVQLAAMRAGTGTGTAGGAAGAAAAPSSVREHDAPGRLKQVMEAVLQLHEQLAELSLQHLGHRRELGQKVDGINRAYISLFEDMLGEVLQIQRAKFCFQTDRIADVSVYTKARSDRSVRMLCRGISCHNLDGRKETSGCR